MKNLILFVALILGSTQVQALSVIVHPSNTAELDKITIGRLYLGKSKSFSTGNLAVPINLSDNSAASNAFTTKVLNKSSNQLKAFWSKLVFTGKGTPPKTVANDTEVMPLVSANPNMIGYIEGPANDSVKVIASF